MRVPRDSRQLQAPALPPLFPRLGRAARLAYGAVAVLAGLPLWGWILDAPRLRDFGADFSPMPLAAALGFLLLACSFFFASRDNPRARRASHAPAAPGGPGALV